MRCEDCEPYLNALADGELSPITAWRVGQHLKACPSCSRSYAEILRISEAAYAWRDITAMPVPEQLRTKIRESAPGANSAIWTTGERPIRRKERFMIAPIPAVAVTISLLAAVFVGVGGQIFPPKTSTTGIAFAQVESAVAQARTAHIRFRIQPDTVSNADMTLTAYDAWLRPDPAAYVLVTAATRMVGDAKGTMLYFEGEATQGGDAPPPMRVSTQPVTREMIEKEMLFPGTGPMREALPIPHDWSTAITTKDDHGRTVLQFVSEENGIRRVLWADPATRLPVRVSVEMHTVPAPNDSTIAPVNTRFWVEFSYNETPPKGIFDQPVTVSKKR